MIIGSHDEKEGGGGVTCSYITESVEDCRVIPGLNVKPERPEFTKRIQFKKIITVNFI